jgi:hypothetical protein
MINGLTIDTATAVFGGRDDELVDLTRFESRH